MPTRLAIAGAAGRMGQRLIALAAPDPRFAIVAAIEASSSACLGRDAGERAGIGPIGLALSAGPNRDFDVLLDFSSPAGTRAALAACTERSSAIIIGVTGHDADDKAAIEAASRRIAVLHAPNMSVGVNVLLRAVEQLARTLGETYDVEIAEVHHRLKVDAPSGTAFALRDAVARGLGNPPASTVHGRGGKTGVRPAREIGMHALRGGDVVGEHEVRFITSGETVTVRHVAHSRDTFALGALRAAAWIAGKPAGRYTMADVLFQEGNAGLIAMTPA